MDRFHPASAPPPPDLADRFVRTVVEARPDWAKFLMPVNPDDPNERVFAVPGPVRDVMIIFEGMALGSMMLAWEGGHLHYGFDWHVEPTVETVTREMIAEAELQLRGDGEEPVIIPLFD